MKTCYPIIITKLPENECTTDASYLVYVPDFEINTEGRDLSDAFDMAREAIELCGITLEDENRPLPLPSDFFELKCNDDEYKLLIDVDFDAFRRKTQAPKMLSAVKSANYETTLFCAKKTLIPTSRKIAAAPKRAQKATRRSPARRPASKNKQITKEKPMFFKGS